MFVEFIRKKLMDDIITVLWDCQICENVHAHVCTHVCMHALAHTHTHTFLHFLTSFNLFFKHISLTVLIMFLLRLSSVPTLALIPKKANLIIQPELPSQTSLSP